MSPADPARLCFGLRFLETTSARQCGGVGGRVVRGARRVLDQRFRRSPRTRQWTSVVALVLWHLAISGLVQAEEETVTLTSGTTRLQLAPWLSVYRDPSCSMNLEQVRQSLIQGRFERGRKPWPSFGFTSDAIWGRFKLRSTTSEPLWFVELRTARMDAIEWWLIRDHGRVEKLTAGNLLERSPELLDCRFPVFPVRLAAGESAEVFLRVKSETSVHLPLQVWEPSAMISAQTGQESVFAAFFGYMMSLILISVILSLFTRGRCYVIYSLSLFALSALYFIVSGFFLWLGIPGASFAVHGGVILTAQTSIVLMLVYLRDLLDLRSTLPRTDRWVSRMATMASILTLPYLLGPYHIMDLFVLLEVLLLGAGSLALGVVAWLNGNRVARFYTLAWLPFWAALAASIFQFLGWIPMLNQPELQVIVGIILSTTLFFVAMGDRVRQLQQSMDQARGQVLELELQAGRELQNQMREQQLLIRDLHDGIGGLTANVAILAEMGRRESAGEKDRALFARIAALASEGGAEVHSLMNSMEARDMQWADFIVECREQGSMILEAHGIDFDCRVTGSCDQPGPGLFPGMSLFRVFKEALTNAVKHSRASRVWVSVEFEPGSLRLTVSDDGRGMGDEAGRGRGLRNMRDRIAELGGQMHRHSASGTRLVFELPIPLAWISAPSEGAHEDPHASECKALSYSPSMEGSHHPAGQA
jgi:signal transduction histidine kinase